MSPAWITITGLTITGALALVGVMWTASASRRAARETARAAPYESLAGRVDRLEHQVGTLREQVEQLERREWRLVQYVRSLWGWIATGMTGTPPVVPTDLHDVLPVHEWGWRPPPDDGQPADVSHASD